MVAEVLGLFTVEAPRRLEAIRAVVGSGDAVALQPAAHTLKGAAGTIGATALQVTCRTIEAMAARGDLTAAGEMARALGVEYARVKSAIELVLADTGAKASGQLLSSSHDHSGISRTFPRSDAR